MQLTDNSGVKEFIDSRNAQLVEIGSDQGNRDECPLLFEVHPAIIEHLAANNIYAVRRVRRSDMEALSKSTNARIVMNIDTFSSKDLGTATLLEEVNIGERPMIKLTGTLTSPLSLS